MKPCIKMIDAMSKIILDFGSVKDQVGDGNQLSKEIDFDENEQEELYENVWE